MHRLDIVDILLHAVAGVPHIADHKEDGKWKRYYGLKAFSPVAKGFDYSHYDDFGSSRSYGYSRLSQQLDPVYMNLLFAGSHIQIIGSRQRLTGGVKFHPLDIVVQADITCGVFSYTYSKRHNKFLFPALAEAI